MYKKVTRIVLLYVTLFLSIILVSTIEININWLILFIVDMILIYLCDKCITFKEFKQWTMMNGEIG